MNPLPTERDLWALPLPELRTLLDRVAAVLAGRLPIDNEEDDLLYARLCDLLEDPALPGRDALIDGPQAEGSS